MHGRSHMIIDPRIPTMSGRSTSGFTNRHPEKKKSSPKKSYLHRSSTRLGGVGKRVTPLPLELHPVFLGILSLELSVNQFNGSSRRANLHPRPLREITWD